MTRAIPPGRLRQVALTALLLAVCADPGAAADLGDGRIHLRHATLVADGARIPDPAPGPDAELAASVTWIVAFSGPATDDVRDLISGVGGRIVGYVPSSAYLVRGAPATAQALAGTDGIVRVARLPPR